ncbi:hypothetical protein [Neolewinella litorea]|uniref:Uncharacterized protein n=1 Tax=Neolewinella litorea TaxID=2562452 RepID=A0A4V3XLS5_9BACT|nr:hypothetical protein [Neolewinella litorea]THH42003.1 hypothetical protein E4021_05305 [Neolewinella litorea]
MPTITPSYTPHAALIEQLGYRDKIFAENPRLIYPWWRFPCRVRLLLVTDSFLDFGTGDFGLSTFVNMLVNDQRYYVRFEITLAHRSSFVGDPGVAVERSIPDFRFTTADHFAADMYDEVWLFGADSGSNPLDDNELLALAAFMNGGGGVFATGDHGSLGKGLCGNVLRVRAMRLWGNTSGKVGMTDPERNDTNRLGHDVGSQFDDQSDDIPQTIAPKLYSNRLNFFWKETYPHPILCSPLGRITVLPDHPHEGECIAPTDLSTTYIDGSAEFPGGIAPEVIAHSTVPAGNTSGSKQATQHHSFGAISAYDGYLADVGRVVTDATWHHNVNVNLIGEQADIEGNRGTTEHPSKLTGFLSTASGQQHLQQIKHYFINTAVWLARKAQRRCFNSHYLWHLTFHHRVIEATTNYADLPFDRYKPSLLYEIGTHAIDVLGRRAGQCRRLELIFEIFYEFDPLRDLIPSIDPWVFRQDEEEDPLLPWINLEPLYGIIIGAGLLAIREKFNDRGFEPDQIEDEEIRRVFLEGAQRGIDLGKDSFKRQMGTVRSLL